MVRGRDGARVIRSDPIDPIGLYLLEQLLHLFIRELRHRVARATCVRLDLDEAPTELHPSFYCACGSIDRIDRTGG